VVCSSISASSPFLARNSAVRIAVTTGSAWRAGIRYPHSGFFHARTLPMFIVQLVSGLTVSCLLSMNSVSISVPHLCTAGILPGFFAALVGFGGVRDGAGLASRVLASDVRWGFRQRLCSIQRLVDITVAVPGTGGESHRLALVPTFVTLFVHRGSVKYLRFAICAARVQHIDESCRRSLKTTTEA